MFVALSASAQQQQPTPLPTLCDRVDMMRVEAQNNPETYEAVHAALIEVFTLTTNYLQKTSIDPNDPLNMLNGNHGENSCGIASMNSINTLTEASKIRSLYLSILTIKGIAPNWFKTYLPEVERMLIEALKYSSAFTELCKANPQNQVAGLDLYRAKFNIYHVNKITDIVRKNVEAPYVYSCQF